MKHLKEIIREDYDWFLEQQEDWFDEIHPTQEEKFDYYLDAVLNNDDGISNSIRTDIIHCAFIGLNLKDI